MSKAEDRKAAVEFASGARGRLRLLAYRAGLALGSQGVRGVAGRLEGFWPEMAPLTKAERQEVRVAVATALVEERRGSAFTAEEFREMSRRESEFSEAVFDAVAERASRECP